MGKSGEALRAAKKKVTYMLTQEQLEERDRKVREMYRERVVAEAREVLKQDEKKIEEDKFFYTLEFALAVSSKILVEEFGWSPLPEKVKPSNRYRLTRFAVAIQETIADMELNSPDDIKNFNQMVFEKYGVGFQWNESEEDEG